MICSSRLYSSVGKSNVFSLLSRNLIAANLCWVCWFDMYGTNVSVKIGFLYMAIFQFGSSVDSYVQVIYRIVCFCFCHEL